MKLPPVLINHYQLSSAFQHALSSRASINSVKKGAYLLREGQLCTKLWFVQSGLVRCYFTRNGTEVTTSFRAEDEFVAPLENFMQQTGVHYFAHAVEDCVLFTMGYVDTQWLLKTFPETRLIGEWIKRTNARADLHKIRATSMLPPKDRYAYFLKHFPGLAARLKLEYIASFLDLSMRSLARARSQR